MYGVKPVDTQFFTSTNQRTKFYSTETGTLAILLNLNSSVVPDPVLL